LPTAIMITIIYTSQGHFSAEIPLLKIYYPHR